MPSEVALETLQQWMHAVIAHPGDVYEALDSPEAKRHIVDVDEVALPSRTLQPAQRVGIYHGMYLMRMIEALRDDYPAVVHYVGDHAFEHLVEAYTQAHPSSSYTFNRFGDHFPEFLASTKLRRKIFLADLARLELAMTQVFDETEAAALDAGAIAGVPPDALESLRFAPIPALRLLAFTYDANGAFQQYRDAQQVHPLRRKSWLALHRRDYSVYRMPLAETEFVFLRTLVNGETIGAALARFHRRFRRLPEQHELFTWFRDWSAAGLFASMETR